MFAWGGGGLAAGEQEWGEGGWVERKGYTLLDIKQSSVWSSFIPSILLPV